MKGKCSFNMEWNLLLSGEDIYLEFFYKELLEASRSGNLKQVQQLLAKGVNIEAMDHNGKYILKLEVKCFLK